jgi:hypothetical protein
MKKSITYFRKLILIGTLSLLMLNMANAQQLIADFEDLSLPSDTCWFGADSTGGFTSGDLYFTNNFTDWGMYTSWSGFAYSNKIDTLTAGYGNQYSAYSGCGYNGSLNYGIYYNDGMTTNRMKTLPALLNDTLQGFYVTNDTYTALSMKFGDSFTKKFGGTSGDDADWFLLTIYAYKDGVRKSDTVDFYLADYRFANNSQDYIVKNWTFVNIQSLGKVDSIEFKLRSTDNGLYGMNTPAYFCFDNFYKKINTSGIRTSEVISDNISVYPNPATDYIHVNSNSIVRTAYIYDLNGKVADCINDINTKAFNVDVNSYNSGVYIVKCVDNRGEQSFLKFIKN